MDISHDTYKENMSYDTTYSEGYELEGAGSVDSEMESETNILFRNLEDELQMLVQRYKVPPTELERLFQVVQHMFELMDANQEALDLAHKERLELENLWKQEKDKLRITQRKKLDLECRLEDEELKNNSKRMELEKERVLLQTRVKQLEENKTNIQQDLHRLKEKMNQSEQMRKDLLEQYKKQADMAKAATLKRKGSSGTLKRRLLPMTPKTVQERWSQEARLTSSLNIVPMTQNVRTNPFRTERFLESDEVSEIQTSCDIEDEKVSQSLYPPRVPSPLPAPARSLAEELEKEGMKNSTILELKHLENGVKHEEGGSESGSDREEEEGEWFEGDESFFEEMLAVDPLMRTEVEMLQKEREVWQVDQRQLEEEKREIREQKEAFERQNMQLQLEFKRLQENYKDLQNKISDVKKERDEILDNYLEQPFDEYCITRKELHELLVKHQNTAFELEKAREEKLQLVKELESRRTIFEKLRQRWRRLFRSKQQSSAEENINKANDSRKGIMSPPPAVRDISSLLKNGDFTVRKGWFMSRDTQVIPDKLPRWVGQITLKGVETERIECSAIGRVYQSPIKSLPPNLGPITGRHKKLALLSTMQQLHAEVWVATIEASSARIEIIDVIARPPKVRQRFVIKPKTSHIVCMLSIPGKIEESHDFADSALLSQETEWMNNSFLSPRQRASSYFGPRLSFKGRERPRSAPKRLSRDFMSSTPNLSLSATSDPGPLELFAASSPETKSRSSQSRRQRSGHDTESHDTDSSSSCSLTTINEVEPHQSSEWVVIESKSDQSKEEEVIKEGSRLPVNDQEVISGIRDEEEEDIPQSTSTPSDNKVVVKETYKLQKRTSIPKFRINEVDYDCTDGEEAPQSLEDHSPIMWILTEDQDLLFYPTTDPSHKAINRIKLRDRAICMEYMKGEGTQQPMVIVGHSHSILSVYHMDEFNKGVWDIENPERITLPCANPNEVHDVKCIACIQDRIWVGAGPSIFFLDSENPSQREGSIFVDSYRRKPEKLLSLGDVVIVCTRGSVFYVFDAQSARSLRKFDISPITHHLDYPIPLDPNSESPQLISAPTDIKTLVADADLLYLGTSNGKIVTVPIKSLRKDSNSDQEAPFQVSKEDECAKDEKDSSVACMSHSAVALHSQMDERVKTLLHLKLPEFKLSKLKEATEVMQYHSLPNLTLPYGGRIPFSPPILSYRSLVISVGKGHVEYIEEEKEEESLEETNARVHKERFEAFQLLVWGHKNSMS